MRLVVDITLALPPFALSAQFASEARLLAVTGASGAGKTTLLKAIAGLVIPSRGRVAVGEQTFFDTERGIALPVHRRRLGFVFQEDRLFPHLTVAQNLRYGTWFARAPLSRERQGGIVALLGIEPLLGRRIGHLSGGERQRVAIGRALFTAPALLLMDEPLASLDEARRAEVLPLIEGIRDRAGVSIVYVSHNPAEVARLADEIVVVADGRAVTQPERTRSGPVTSSDSARA